MPQVDLETLVCGGAGTGTGDGKVSCETLILSDQDPNFPPESIRFSIQDLPFEYLAGAAASVTYDRDDSAKESTNPKSQYHNPNPNPSTTRSGSQRYSSANLKANGPIIGLPNKIKHVTLTCSRPRPQTSSRIFPKKKTGAKSGVPAYEPTSPKVSCFGKVLSDRERYPHRRRSPDPKCWAPLAALFSCGGREKTVEERDDVARGNIPLKRRNVALDDDDVEVGPAAAEAPGIGGMKRFASGRRAASWGGDGEGEGEGHVAVDLRRRSLDCGAQ